MLFDHLKSLTRLSQRAAIPDTEYSPLQEYIFIDRPRLKSYIEQISGPSTVQKIPNWDISLSITGPTVTGKQAAKERPFTDHEMITILCEHLRSHKLLAANRPKHHQDIQQPFVLEQLKATKAIFPSESKGFPNALKEIALWLSDPSPEDLKGSLYSQGTFLYLVEAYWDGDRQCQTTHSGLSALNLILNEFVRESIVADVPKAFLGEVCSPSCLLSPIETLDKLGAAIQPPRTIEALYRKRYLTDEQFFKNEKGDHRSNDLFAYPIYIKDLTHKTD